jgi:hypothetical protein
MSRRGEGLRHKAAFWRDGSQPQHSPGHLPGLSICAARRREAFFGGEVPPRPRRQYQPAIIALNSVRTSSFDIASRAPSRDKSVKLFSRASVPPAIVSKDDWEWNCVFAPIIRGEHIDRGALFGSRRAVPFRFRHSPTSPGWFDATCLVVQIAGDKFIWQETGLNLPSATAPPRCSRSLRPRPRFFTYCFGPCVVPHGPGYPFGE